MNRTQYMIVGGKLFHSSSKPIKRYGRPYEDSTDNVSKNRVPGEYIGPSPVNGFPSRIRYKNMQYQLTKSEVYGGIQTGGLNTIKKVATYVNADDKAIRVILMNGKELYRISW